MEVKSKRDKEDPSRIIPKTLDELPIRIKERRESVLPI
jgi:hypothetical protein